MNEGRLFLRFFACILRGLCGVFIDMVAFLLPTECHTHLLCLKYTHTQVRGDYVPFRKIMRREGVSQKEQIVLT